MFETRLKSHHKEKTNEKPDFVLESELLNFLENSLPDNKNAIAYFHIPFCDNICSFCSMNRTKLNGELDEYTNFLVSEIEKYSKLTYIKNKKFGSIYFGGGTPTILKNKHLQRILTAINTNLNLLDDCEFSLESTLHNLNLNKLALLQNLGVNRLSIGIQSFSDRGRKFFNRIYDGKRAKEKLFSLKEKFNGQICIDIIYNYPNQTQEEVTNDAKNIMNLKLDSVSFYSLIFFEGSELYKQIPLDYYDLNTDKNLHHTFVKTLLSDKNYEFLEITKLTRKNSDKYKYIRLNHSGADILPIGKGAGGRLGKYSIFNASMDKKIIMKKSECDMKFDKFLSLFQYPQINLDLAYSYLKNHNELEQFLQKCQKNGYTHIDKNSLKYTLDGIFWANSIEARIANLTKKDIR